MPSFMRQISVLYRCSSIFRAEKYKELGLKLGTCHHSYILLLCRHPGISQDAISKHICINKSNVTRHLVQLEKNGYVERKQSETDKRVTLVYPTEKAYEVLPVLRDANKQWKDYITDGLTDEEITLAVNVLQKMAKRAAENVERELTGEDSAE